VSASLRDAVPLAERAAYGVVALDIEAVDPHAGGYAWTAVGGSVAIAAGNAWHNAANPFDAVGLWAEPGHGGTAATDAAAFGKAVSGTKRAATGTEFLEPKDPPPDSLSAFRAGIHPLRAAPEVSVRARDVQDGIFHDLHLELPPLDESLHDFAEHVASAWE